MFIKVKTKSDADSIQYVLGVADSKDLSRLLSPRRSYGNIEAFGYNESRLSGCAENHVRVEDQTATSENIREDMETKFMQEIWYFLYFNRM